MTPERWQRVSQLYEAVLERPAHEREAFLVAACAGNSDLRRELESLLSQDDRQSPLDRPVWVPDDLLSGDVAGAGSGDPARYNAAPPPSMRLAPGTRLGPYEIESPIGAGGMGEVYRGRDSRLDRVVALKILKPEVAADPAFRARFDREARTISQLDHPNICPLYDVGDQDGVAFLVMPFLEGGSLLDRLRRGPLPLAEALRIAIAMASALTYAHGRGVLHRDVKPQNVLILSDGRAMLLDFGIAKPYGLDSAETTAGTAPALTRFGQTLGTLEYMSPEQLAGRVLDGRSDMFSLGVVIHELATGTHPFRSATPALTASAILEGKYSTGAGVVSGDLDRIVRRMLAVAPGDRFPSMADCLADLRLLEHDSGPRAATARPRVALRRRRGLIIAAGVVLPWILIAAFAAWRGRTPNAAASPTPSASVVSPVAPAASALSFWLDVEPAGTPQGSFQSVGDHVFGRDSRFKVNVVAAASGHVYLVNDDPAGPGNKTGLALVFARAIGTTPAPITSDSIAFTGGPSRDHLWLVWSASPIPELEALIPALETKHLGVLSDAAAATSLRARFRTAASQARFTTDPSTARAVISGSSPIVAHELELQHD